MEVGTGMAFAAVLVFIDAAAVQLVPVRQCRAKVKALERRIEQLESHRCS